jgi:tetratricopeptide (TPR) repeat protein
MKRTSSPFVLLLASAVLALATWSSSARAQDAPTQWQQSYDLELEGKMQDSLSALERVPAPQQTYVFHFRRGWLLLLLGRYADSIAAYERASALSPAAVECQVGLMLPQMALRRWVDVEKTALSVLQRDPASYLASSRLAWAYYNLGRWADAAAVYRRVLAAYPSDVEMRVGLGWSLLKQGKAAEAAVELRQVLEIAPRHKTAREGLQAAGVVR